MIDSTFLSELADLGLTGPQYQGVLSAVSRLFAIKETNDLALEERREKDRIRQERHRSRDSHVTVTRDRGAPQGPNENNSNPNPPPVANATAQIWIDVPPLLTSLGLQEKAARANLGRWLKTNTPEEIRRAVNAAVQAGTGDPIPYILKTLKGMSKNFAPLRFRPEPEKISNEEWRKSRMPQPHRQSA